MNVLVLTALLMVQKTEGVVYQNGSTTLCDQTDIRTVLGAVEALRIMVYTEIQELRQMNDTTNQHQHQPQTNSSDGVSLLVLEHLQGNITLINQRLDDLTATMQSDLLSVQSELASTKASLQSQV